LNYYNLLIRDIAYVSHTREVTWLGTGRVLRIFGLMTEEAMTERPAK
jgi:hypothetical protein